MAFADGKAVALATSHTLTISPSITTERTKDDAVGPVGEFDYAEWSVSCDSVMGENDGVSNEQTYETLLALQLAGTEVTLVFDAVGSAVEAGQVPATGWTKGTDQTDNFAGTTGKAIVSSVNISAGSAGKATVSVTFTGVGVISAA